MNSSAGAAVETFGALIACLCGGGLVKNACHAAAVALRAPAASLPSAAGAGHCAGCALTFVALYSARLRPGSPSLLQSCASVLRGLAHAFVGAPPLSPAGGLLLAFHAASLAWLGSGGGGLGGGALWACASSSRLLWAPLFEELLFRCALFYLALQRSGGSVPLAAALCAGAFAAMHAPNVLGAGADWGYVALQVLAAAACGGAWTCVFAARGSLAEVALLHAANNAAAVVWLATTRSALPCSLVPPPPDQRMPALASLCLQTAVYGAGGLMAWRALQRSTGEDGGRAFRAAHPILYCPEGEAAALALASGKAQ
jgi:membrane protease YdiL (CAAX protease family)